MRRSPTTALLPALAAVLLGSCAPVAAAAESAPGSPTGEAAGAPQSTSTTETSSATTTTTSAPSTVTETATTTTASETNAASQEAAAEARPTVEGQTDQRGSEAPGPKPSGKNAPKSSHAHTHPAGKSHHHSGAHHGAHHASAPTPGRKAPSPSALTPPLPSALTVQGASGAVPNFFIATFGIPPFLLPIYQAAGSAYGVPWQVLAAINEVETDYGRDLNLSSAGAEGWMQFLPSTWLRYGMDANGDGYEDPYNPADAIFAAARYLKAAGADHNIRAAIFAYNHSKAYVESVMLRAELLGGTPPDLLGAIAGLTEDRFPVHAPAHFSDGFTELPSAAAAGSQTLVGTTIYSREDAPVIAVQDGEITAMGDSPELGRYVSLRDPYGNTYTYAGLGSLASLYPVLVPRESAPAAPAAAASSQPASEPAPTAPASAGVQPRPGASAGAAPLGTAPLGEPPAQSKTASAPPSAPVSQSTPSSFQAGSEEVYLHSLHPGVHVIAGTVLGHLGPASSLGEPGSAEPHMLFQIRPAGADAPLIDPKPVLDGWVELEDSSVYRAAGQSPFLATAPTPGQALLESKSQLVQQVLRDPGIELPSCTRGEIQSGGLDRRVLAALEFLSVSGLRPGISQQGCNQPAPAAAVYGAGASIDITSIDGLAVAANAAPGTPVDEAIQKLTQLQGTMRPLAISAPGDHVPSGQRTSALPGDAGVIHVAFAPTGARAARAGGSLGSSLSGEQWVKLIARLGQVPNPAVRAGHSPAAIAVPGAAAPTNGEANGNG